MYLLEEHNLKEIIKRRSPHRDVVKTLERVLAEVGGGSIIFGFLGLIVEHSHVYAFLLEDNLIKGFDSEYLLYFRFEVSEYDDYWQIPYHSENLTPFDDTMLEIISEHCYDTDADIMVEREELIIQLLYRVMGIVLMRAVGDDFPKYGGNTEHYLSLGFTKEDDLVITKVSQKYFNCWSE